MHPDGLWLLTVLHWLGLPWLIAYLLSGITSVTRWDTPAETDPEAAHAARGRRLPRLCQTDHALATALRAADSPPLPWNEVKSPRGRQKSIDTRLICLPQSGVPVSHDYGCPRTMSRRRWHSRARPDPRLGVSSLRPQTLGPTRHRPLSPSHSSQDRRYGARLTRRRLRPGRAATRLRPPGPDRTTVASAGRGGICLLGY